MEVRTAKLYDGNTILAEDIVVRLEEVVRVWSGSLTYQGDYTLPRTKIKAKASLIPNALLLDDGRKLRVDVEPQGRVGEGLSRLYRFRSKDVLAFDLC